MANITVNYHEIDTAASQLGNGKEEISARLHSLQQQIQQLVASGFITEHASVRFGDSYREFTNSAQSVIAKLTEIQSFLTTSASAIRDLDAQIAAQIR